MKAATTYTSMVLEAAYEIEALMQLQLVALAESDDDSPELLALRGLALRVSGLACLQMGAMSSDDAPKESIARLQARLYGKSVGRAQGGAA